jgi:hypothetical protein
VKTDSIKQCVGLVRLGGYSSLPSNAAEELKALEESNSEMARVLADGARFMALLLDGDPAWQKVDRMGLHVAMLAALRKAGVQP